jgi:signal transduction histidine kinase
LSSFKNEVSEIAGSQLQKLAVLESLLTNIIDYLPVNFFVIDQDGNYIIQSATLTDVVEGGRKANLIDKASWNDCKQVMQQNKKKIIEEQYDNKWFLSIKSPLIIDQEIVGVVGFSIDISKQKEIDELTKQQEIQQSIIHKLKTIAGSLAHEIRTPLAGIRTGLSVVNNFIVKAKQNIAEVTEEALAYQEQWILRMIERLDNGHSLINIQLKNMATERIDSKIFCKGDLTEWITQAVTKFPFENQSAAKKIHLEIPEGMTVTGDPLLTQHVLWNLLNNAFHFIKETDRGEIFITAEISEKYYILRVKDTAKGMSDKEAAQVFKQFYTNRPGGSGLGLHFCQLVMEAYQGHIECRAEEGQYTEFLLFFPKEFASQSKEPPLAESESSATV